MKHIFSYCLAALLLCLPALLPAQNARQTAASGDKALGSYNFEAAKADYTRALVQTADSTERVVLMEKITWCENGSNMLKYASRPRVLSSITVPRNRFFLYYSHFPDKSWRRGKDGSPFLYTEDMETVIIPVRDEYGTFDLNTSTRLSDGRWSPLTDMGDGINSVEDEVLPVLSDGGKKVYFSSKGLYGMGGYDLFVSEWDDKLQRWGEAQNLGFPYSSPYDDLLFCNTPDGNFSLFASNRACSADSVVIYLLQYDPNPVKTPVESVEQARAIASLRPRPTLNLDIDESQFVHTMYGDDAFARYFNLVGRYGAVKDSISMLQHSIAQTRQIYAEADEVERKDLSAAIIDTESIIFKMQGRLSDIASEIQAVEMEFLIRGQEINPEELSQSDIEATMDAPGAATIAGKPQYTFMPRTLGATPQFDFVQPEPKIDLTFRVEDDAVLIEDYKLPEGLVYQIQIAATINKLTAARLKGFSPAFEFRDGGKYIYRVGLFNTYAEANKHLATVKKKGFSSAMVVALDNGKTINVKKARDLEAQRKENMKYRVVFREYPGGIPSAILSVVRESSPVDIARGSEEGRIIYFIAPLEKGAADAILQKAVAAGAEGVEVEPVKQ